MTNKHGLTRKIPDDVKSAVRKACGFGCVVCGAVPYDYDHFRVPFADAKEHNPDDIILLCDCHHREKGAGLLDVDMIETARRVKGPDRENHFRLAGTSSDFAVHWLSIQIIKPRQHTILVDDEPVLELKVQEDELEPVLLNGVFSGRDGREICRVSNNEFTSRPANLGDFTLIKNRFTYQSLTKEKTLSFELTPRGIQISELCFVRKNAFVFGNSRVFRVGNDQNRIDVTGTVAEDCLFAISIATPGRQSIDYRSVDFERMPCSYMRGSVSGYKAAVVMR